MTGVPDREAAAKQGLVQCWCPGCGMVKLDYAPFPFCRHNIEATAPHPARRMEPLPPGHPGHPSYEAVS